MMSSRVTPVVEEEGTKVEGAEKEGGTAKFAGSIVPTRGHFSRSRALLRRTEPTYMAPMMVKKGEKGIGTEKC